MSPQEKAQFEALQREVTQLKQQLSVVPKVTGDRNKYTDDVYVAERVVQVCVGGVPTSPSTVYILTSINGKSYYVRAWDVGMFLPTTITANGCFDEPG